MDFFNQDEAYPVLHSQVCNSANNLSRKDVKKEKLLNFRDKRRKSTAMSRKKRKLSSNRATKQRNNLWSVTSVMIVTSWASSLWILTIVSQEQNSNVADVKIFFQAKNRSIPIFYMITA